MSCLILYLWKNKLFSVFSPAHGAKLAVFQQIIDSNWGVLYCSSKAELVNSEQGMVYGELEQSKFTSLKSFNGHMFLWWNVNSEDVLGLWNPCVNLAWCSVLSQNFHFMQHLWAKRPLINLGGQRMLDRSPKYLSLVRGCYSLALLVCWYFPAFTGAFLPIHIITLGKNLIGLVPRLLGEQF